MESIYLGGFTVCLGLAAAGLRRVPSLRVWLTVVVMAGLAGSLGSYGSPLFWARSIPRLQSFVGTHASSSEGWPDPSAIPDGVGGPYWFMTVALPGFGSSPLSGEAARDRQPGSLRAGRLGLGRASRGASRRSLWLAFASILASLLAAICVALPPTHAAFVGFLEARPEMTTTVFGPLEPSGSLGDLWRAIVQGGCVAGLLIALAALQKAPLAGCLAVAISCLDLGLARWAAGLHRPPERLRRQAARLEAIDRAEAKDPSPGPFRIHRQSNWAPMAWLSKDPPAGSTTSAGAGSGTVSAPSMRSRKGWLTPTPGVRPSFRISSLSSVACGSSSTRKRVADMASPKAIRSSISPAAASISGTLAILSFLPRLAFGSRFRGVLSFLPRTTEIDPPPRAVRGTWPRRPLPALAARRRRPGPAERECFPACLDRPPCSVPRPGHKSK